MKKHISGIIATTLITMALLMGLFASCNPQKKLAKAEATLSAAGVLPKICADRYPVRVVTDSTEYKNSLAVIDSLIKAQGNEKDITDRERELLSKEIDSLKSIPEINCDELSEAIYRLAAKEKKRADNLQIANENLIKAAKNLKPIRDTAENTARVDEYKNLLLQKDKDLAKKDAKIGQLEDEVKNWKGKAKDRFWWILILVGAIGAYTFLRIKKILPF